MEMPDNIQTEIGSVRVERWKAEKVLRDWVGDDVEMGQALGLLPYEGINTSRTSAGPKRVIRMPDLVDGDANTTIYAASPYDKSFSFIETWGAQ